MDIENTEIHSVEKLSDEERIKKAKKEIEEEMREAEEKINKALEQAKNKTK